MKLLRGAHAAAMFWAAPVVLAAGRVVGDPDREYLWILARAPRLDDASLAAARATARDNGFDVDRLVATPQTGARRP